ncbi:MAG: adenylate/guanylate cyclase domain-containing protein [Brevinemataceae bacterium]
MSSKPIKINKSLRYKILFVVIPLFLISFGFLILTAYFSSNNGITNIAKEFIGYRLKDVLEFSQTSFAEQQLLEAASLVLEENTDLNKKIIDYSLKLEPETLIIVPYINEEITSQSLSHWTIDTNFNQKDLQNLHTFLNENEERARINPENRNIWLEFTTCANKKYVGLFLPNIEFNAWFVLIAPREYFYYPVTNILYYFGIIATVSIIVMIVFLLFFVNFLTRPLAEFVDTICDITNTMDFGKRIKIYYLDEIGFLGQYFNIMIGELEKSYTQIKNYAYQTVLAKQKEERVRFIFQKYVPTKVIDQVLNKTSSTMLIGTKQNVTVLFSDIRDFTTISEQIQPEDLVLSLNEYFTAMVSQIIALDGLVDKFIGDAIMAIFGAPMVNEYDADRAVESALNMISELKKFNEVQRAKKKITFDIGIGLNTGNAIVGNIGSDQKLDYTVIGDPVNLGARLEGLTKSYQMPILISEFTKNAILNPDKFFFINVDTVRVKGKAFPVTIYSPLKQEDISSLQKEFYNIFHEGQHFYYEGQFTKALNIFLSLKEHPAIHSLLHLYIKRCNHLIQNPPDSWDGVETWKTK